MSSNSVGTCGRNEEQLDYETDGTPVWNGSRVDSDARRRGYAAGDDTGSSIDMGVG